MATYLEIYNIIQIYIVCSAVLDNVHTPSSLHVEWSFFDHVSTKSIICALRMPCFNIPDPGILIGVVIRVSSNIKKHAEVIL